MISRKQRDVFFIAVVFPMLMVGFQQCSPTSFVGQDATSVTKLDGDTGGDTGGDTSGPTDTAPPPLAEHGDHEGHEDGDGNCDRTGDHREPGGSTDRSKRKDGCMTLEKIPPADLERVACSDGKGVNCVQICHVPAGNPSNARTLVVGIAALDSHVLHHGDYIGACGARVGQVCQGN